MGLICSFLKMSLRHSEIGSFLEASPSQTWPRLKNKRHQWIWGWVGLQASQEFGISWPSWPLGLCYQHEAPFGLGQKTSKNNYQKKKNRPQGPKSARPIPGPSCRGVLAGLPHTTGLGFQTGHPDRRVLVGPDIVASKIVKVCE